MTRSDTAARRQPARASPAWCPPGAMGQPAWSRAGSWLWSTSSGREGGPPFPNGRRRPTGSRRGPGHPESQLPAFKYCKRIYSTPHQHCCSLRRGSRSPLGQPPAASNTFDGLGSSRAQPCRKPHVSLQPGAAQQRRSISRSCKVAPRRKRASPVDGQPYVRGRISEWYSTRPGK